MPEWCFLLNKHLNLLLENLQKALQKECAAEEISNLESSGEEDNIRPRKRLRPARFCDTDDEELVHPLKHTQPPKINFGRFIKGSKSITI